MWSPEAVTKRAARVLAAAAFAWIGMQACAVDRSGDPALLTVKVDTGATRFSQLYVILQDSAGADTLWRDSLRDPSQLSHLSTHAYRGQAATVIVEGYQSGRKVYEEKRSFDPADPAADKRDTVQDLTAALTGFAWAAKETLLPYGDSTHLLTLSALPAKADPGAVVSLSDSSILIIREEDYNPASGDRRYRLLARKAGRTWVIAKALGASGRVDSASVLVSAGAVTVPKPVNRSQPWSTSARPTWIWSSGGRGGIGFYYLRIDNDSLAGGLLLGDTAYTAPAPLADGPHVLYARERDSAGQFSPPAGFAITVDTRAPEAPKVANAALEATDDPHPAWKWVPQGGGIGRYRLAIDAEPDTASRLSDSARFTAEDSLAPGAHTLKVQERDSAGNWSPSGSATVTVVLPDKIPPGKPVRVGGFGAPVFHDTLSWRSGGNGGAGVYRYLIDKSDFDKDGAIEIHDSVLVPPPDLDTTIVLHYLRVQERDAVGNWSATGEITFNAYHFTFLRSLADSAYVLTVTADSLHVQLTRQVLAPAGDSGAALQKRQLWQRIAEPGTTQGYRWSNPFTRLDLQGGEDGKPLGMIGFTHYGIDSTKVWSVPQVSFVGGAPPPYFFLSSFQNNLAVTVDGAVADTTAITLRPNGGGDPKQLWLIQAMLGKWWLL